MRVYRLRYVTPLSHYRTEDQNTYFYRESGKTPSTTQVYLTYEAARRAQAGVNAYYGTKRRRVEVEAFDLVKVADDD